jgi:hypothetical protein
MPRQFACDFERKCGVIELETNKAGHLVIQVNGARLPIDMSTNALAPPALNRPLPDEDPVPYSPCDCSVPIGGEGADNYGISRGLFYPRPDGERGGALVLDLAFGDTRLGVTDATWPPCGCRKVKDCMPIADTTHHGTHFEVVLPIDSAIPPPPPEPEPPSPGPLTTLDLDAAARQAKVVAPRTDGIYATVPVCSTGRRWERRFVAFFGDGHAHTLESNESPLSALRTIEHGLMITPHGRYHVTGSRITSKLFDDMAEEREGAKPRASFDAVVMDGGLHIQLKEPKPDARVESYRFVPVKSGVESHSCSF